MFTKIATDLKAVRSFDHIVSSDTLEFGEAADEHGRATLAVQVGGQAEQLYTFNDHARAQLAGRFGVPLDHFDRLPRQLQVAELEHFTRAAPETVTLRAFEQANGTRMARSFMSGKYTPFDTSEVLETAAPILERSGYELARSNIGRDEASVFAVMPQEHDVSGPRAKGDIVKTGIAIRNSEIGTASLSVEFLLYRLICTNGMVSCAAEVSVKQRHIYISPVAFRAQLEGALHAAKTVGEEAVGLLRGARALTLAPADLDPKSPGTTPLARAVLKILAKAGLATQKFHNELAKAIGPGGREEPNLFGVVQFLTGDFARSAGSLDETVRRERLGGTLMKLAA